MLFQLRLEQLEKEKDELEVKRKELEEVKNKLETPEKEAKERHQQLWEGWSFVSSAYD